VAPCWRSLEPEGLSHGPGWRKRPPDASSGNNLAQLLARWARITFTSYRDYQEENGCEIYIMRTDGSQVTRLTDNNTCDWQPRWGY
jgi:hypothetical protein